MLIIEDQDEERQMLERLVGQADRQTAVYAAASEERGYAVAMRHSIDLFVVDINLHPGREGGDLSGAFFAQNIRGVKRYCFTPIIFVTGIADPRLNLQNIVRHCFVVRKPYDERRLGRILSAALNYQSDEIEQRRVFFQNVGALESVPAEEIIYADSLRRALHVESVHRQFNLSGKTCKAPLEELDSEDFVRCRKGTVVNLNFIQRIDPVNRYIYLKMTRSVLEIGPVIKKGFLEEVREKFPTLFS